MSSFGDFTELTFVNDVANPAVNAANLNAMQDKINKLDDELGYSATQSKQYMLDYFLARNYKAISLCDDASNWSAGNASTTVSQDTTNSRVGYGGIKVLENDSSAGWVYAYRNITSLDLTTFQNGVDTASTSDGICWLVYVSDKTKINGLLTLKLGSDNSNNYYYTFTPVSIVDGWNAWFTLKSDFTSTGSVNWNAITYLHIEWASYASATNAYITLDFLGMYRNNGGFPGIAMVKNAGSWTTGSLISTYMMRLYFDHAYGKTGFALGAENNEFPLKIQTNILNFACQSEWYVTNTGELAITKWYYNSDNYIDAYITGGTMYLYLYQAGAATTVSQAMPATLNKGTRVTARLEKNGTQVRAIFSFNRQSTVALESTTTITNPGSIYICGAKNTGNSGFLTDFVVSNNTAFPLEKDWQGTRVIVKQAGETVTNSAVLQDDDEFNFTLPANGLYEIEAVLYASAGSTTPDIKTLWVLGGGSTFKIGNASSIRVGMGIGTSATSSQNAETANMTALGMGSYPTTAFSYGTHTSSWSTCILEKFLVNVGGAYGTCKLQWAQDTSNANGTTLNSGSYIKITKLTK